MCCGELPLIFVDRGTFRRHYKLLRFHRTMQNCESDTEVSRSVGICIFSTQQIDVVRMLLYQRRIPLERTLPLEVRTYYVEMIDKRIGLSSRAFKNQGQSVMVAICATMSLRYLATAICLILYRPISSF